MKKSKLPHECNRLHIHHCVHGHITITLRDDERDIATLHMDPEEAPALIKRIIAQATCIAGFGNHTTGGHA